MQKKLTGSTFGVRTHTIVHTHTQRKTVSTNHTEQDATNI